jgi:hypothetical protein
MPAGELEVVVTGPPPDLPWQWGEQEPIDGVHERDAEEILAGFHAARQAEGASAEEADLDSGAAQEMLDYKATVGGPIADWEPEDIEVYLLEHYPSHGSETGEELEAVPRRLDAFLAWLAASGRGPAARLEAARKRLAECREQFLKDAGNPGRFGSAKVVLQAMREANVDVTDDAAVDAFLRDFNRRVGLDPSLLPLPPVGRRAKAWVWNGEGPAPDPRGACPCGSGRRYRKCCLPR